jgi:serine/threonine-protein kinase SRPK3
MMNGEGIKKAAMNKVKQAANAANGNGGKKRRKGTDLKPIITTEGQQAQEAGAGAFDLNNYGYVLDICGPA